MKTLNKVFNKSSILVPGVAILLGLIVGAIAMLAGGYNPIVAYYSLLDKLFSSPYNIGEAIRAITPLIFTGIAVAFAFRTGLFNIGVEGQFIMGMTGATLVGVTLDLPWYIHAPLAVITGAVFGGVWAAIAGFLKATRGVNEVISSIMLNWIALFLSNYIVATFLVEKGQQKSRPVHESALLTIDWLIELMDKARMHWGTFIAIICIVVFYVLLWRTKQGYELRAVGHNPDAALYAGMNVNRTIVKSMFISGLFAGLGGVFEILGVFGYQTVMAASWGYGFDGIAVALLGGNTPVGVLLGAILFGGLNYGSTGMSFGAGVPSEVVRIVIGSVIFFVASHGLVKWFLKPFLNKRASKRKEAV
ncbi:ABC transporter permease [Paenibacillus prosopidis]|uniref:Nucleoside ABC transporter membrane protein n=1 Tax=Paenibacillus prosopidis TaxID=630520 RepID=A0A368VIS9_9BACL|nr:ABC transporter permease [Paenibacillus prosopidis]RCW41396.1 nucleoside ABC transporter membrane protein [Paenibacillus prosopidis]